MDRRSRSIRRIGTIGTGRECVTPSLPNDELTRRCLRSWAFKPCLDAVNASTPNVRERWERYHAKYAPGPPRLLKAMSDVTYIPHTKRDLVLEATPLFVDCFLEIGLPTFTAIALDEGETPERLEFVRACRFRSRSCYELIPTSCSTTSCTITM